MAEVRALRLRLTAPAGWTARAVARTEEALRLAADEHRLVVVRRLDLGRLAVTAPAAEWQARTADRMTAMTRAAVHGTAPGAERAGAVWFAGAAEARALLLGELAAGRPPSGWFWPLAVPEWRGATLADWLGRELAAAGRAPERLVQLGQAVVRLAATGRLAALVAAMPEGMFAAPAKPLAAGTTEGATRPPLADSGSLAAGPASGPSDDAAGLADRLLARLDGTARAAIVAELRRLPPTGRRAALLARLALAAAAPELAGRPTVLVDLAQAVIAASAPAAPEPWHPPALEGDGAAAARNKPPELSSASPAVVAHARHPSEAVPPQPPVGSTDQIGDDVVAALRAERASAAAGLWLLVRPLARLGFDDWLAARPHLAAAGGARGLLRHIAERQRIAADDPVFDLLPAPAVPVDPALFDLWRVGLDRWLRRRIRRRLADVVRRRGWLTAQATEVRVRFRLDQADIALRARALDVDPGWTAWLGLTIAYDYRDEARR